MNFGKIYEPIYPNNCDYEEKDISFSSNNSYQNLLKLFDNNHSFFYENKKKKKCYSSSKE